MFCERVNDNNVIVLFIVISSFVTNTTFFYPYMSLRNLITDKISSFLHIWCWKIYHESCFQIFGVFTYLIFSDIVFLYCGICSLGSLDDDSVFDDLDVTIVIVHASFNYLLLSHICYWFRSQLVQYWVR